ncbi:MAG: phytoene/squalene synthase family protein [Nitrospiraceae bacterium]
MGTRQALNVRRSVRLGLSLAAALLATFLIILQVSSPSHTALPKRRLLRDLLKRVSRLFYTTLVVVPSPVRDQVSLSYLFARVADTIADTDLIDRPQRLRFLHQFTAQFVEDQVCWDEVRAIQTVVIPCQTNSAERGLLERLEDCFRLYLNFSPEDRTRVRRLMTTLTSGMEMDLTVFPGDSARHLTALKTMADLDQYTYFVAGCVGEFWTDLMCGHLSSLNQWNVTDMARIGVRFGKGLQLTNILKDLSRDLRRGRCYVPEPMLREAGLAPTDLLKKDVLPAFRPVLKRLVAAAMEHLDQGWLYTMAIPRREVRLRLACMWPILSAGATLRLVSISTDLLDPLVTLKISRRQVYRIMALTTLTGACGSVGTAYWGHLRKQIV